MNIKNYREKELTYYTILLIIIIFISTDILPIEELLKNDNTSFTNIKVINISIVAYIIYVISYILDSLIPSHYKNILVFISSTIPGETAFTYLLNNNDIRMSKNDLLKQYKKIYEEIQTVENPKKFQNSSWYKIYKKYQSFPMIESSHRDYLLSRDLYIITLIITSLYIFFSCLHIELIKRSPSCYIALISLTIIMNISTRIKSRRFVSNVIALDINTPSSSRVTWLNK